VKLVKRVVKPIVAADLSTDRPMDARRIHFLPLKGARAAPDNRSMSLARRVRGHLSYANVMSSIAVFVALGGGAYALSVPKNSVGPRQLKRNSVTNAKIKRNAVTNAKIAGNAITGAKLRDGSIAAGDLAPGVIPTPAAASPAAPPPLGLGGAKAADTDPPATPGTQLQSASFSLSSAGKAFVLGTVVGPFLACGGSPCQADWGIYVDGQPVPATGLHLQAGAGGGDGFDFYALFGVTPTLQPGSHSVALHRTSSGGVASVGQLGSPQLGTIAVGA
jgi:hypothetical protein